MITIDLLIKEDTTVGFEIRGHANYDEYGSDIVCSAVTILAYTCVNTLDQYGDNIKFSDEADVMKLITNDSSNEIEVIFAYFETGIVTLETSYDTYVKINYKEV